jgi:hypothetical protein
MQVRSVALMVVPWLLCTGNVMTASPLWAEEAQQQAAHPGTSNAEPAPVIMKELPAMMAEGSNKCEIVSCGMGIKETCEITCPSDKTPKCSCDCIRNIGPLCMEYKANCRCE